MVDRASDGRRLSPVVARRRLRRLFVQARKHAGFVSREAAAAALGWSPRKQALLETDEQQVPRKDLEVILATFAIPDDQRAEWRQLVEAATTKGWWDVYDDADLSAEGKQFVGLDWGARRIRSFDGSILPALLQIPGYTRAALAAGLGDRPREQVNQLLAVRRRRQRVLANPDPLDYHVILDEAALRRPGGDAETMRAQLDHLVDLASTRRNITVQVVPFAAGLYSGQSGTFMVMDLGPSGADESVVHVEPGFASARYVDQRNELYLYSLVFQNLLEVALGPGESADLIRAAAEAL
jgi:hypothetical protein